MDCNYSSILDKHPLVAQTFQHVVSGFKLMQTVIYCSCASDEDIHIVWFTSQEHCGASARRLFRSICSIFRSGWQQNNIIVQYHWLSVRGICQWPLDCLHKRADNAGSIPMSWCDHVLSRKTYMWIFGTGPATAVARDKIDKLLFDRLSCLLPNHHVYHAFISLSVHNAAAGSKQIFCRYRFLLHMGVRFLQLEYLPHIYDINT